MENAHQGILLCTYRRTRPGILYNNQVGEKAPAPDHKTRRAKENTGGKAAGGSHDGVAMTPPPDKAESPADMIFILAGRQERIAERLAHKIERLDRRVTALEQQRRLP